MKYVIYAVFLIVGVATGMAGGTYLVINDFEEMAGITWEQYTTGYDNCAKEAQEPCNMYGGFAPLSQFSK